MLSLLGRRESACQGGDGGKWPIIMQGKWHMVFEPLQNPTSDSFEGRLGFFWSRLFIYEL